MNENKFVIADNAGNIHFATIHSIFDIIDNRFCIYSTKNNEGNFDFRVGQIITNDNVSNIVPIQDENDKIIATSMLKEITDIAKKYERRP